MKFLFGLLLFSFLGWVAVRLLIQRLRRMRGEPIPEQKGPRTVTIVCVALIAIYAVLLLWRFYSEGFSAFG
jgi:predicted tellurium resistance membrane protein TerC